MSQAIPLIQKEDGFEQVRDAIAAILATESAAQQVLAIDAALDPEPWDFRVYSERVDPWETFRDKTDDSRPVVNIWYDSSSYEMGASNVATRQKTDPSRFNVDVYTSAVSSETVGGHTPGDEAASKRAHHVVKLARNILMHDKYKYLGLRGLVWRRWVGQITAFQPSSGNQPLNRIAACRLVLEVEHIETIELEDHETLEILNIKLKHEPDGQIIAELEYDFSA